jgi:hypothetical protein
MGNENLAVSHGVRRQSTRVGHSLPRAQGWGQRTTCGASNASPNWLRLKSADHGWRVFAGKYDGELRGSTHTSAAAEVNGGSWCTAADTKFESERTSEATYGTVMHVAIMLSRVISNMRAFLFLMIVYFNNLTAEPMGPTPFGTGTLVAL